ncbi:putative Dynein heavy chain-like protein [Glarea lozoyensis 74030]|uniref:Putative Dynein heavy chain-like protein n=1 Tax=Glarea lozoyensis (strain ATCC 74030 / MF5533) TaxID=1104152 RepID=H0EZJ1_GLAL7|nr:putative Dynein heavy chain-like protein [Glarea lozoyensis 74030]
MPLRRIMYRLRVQGREIGTGFYCNPYTCDYGIRTDWQEEYVPKKSETSHELVEEDELEEDSIGAEMLDEDVPEEEVPDEDRSEEEINDEASSEEEMFDEDIAEKVLPYEDISEKEMLGEDTTEEEIPDEVGSDEEMVGGIIAENNTLDPDAPVNANPEEALADDASDSPTEENDSSVLKQLYSNVLTTHVFLALDADEPDHPLPVESENLIDDVPQPLDEDTDDVTNLFPRSNFVTREVYHAQMWTLGHKLKCPEFTNYTINT